ncbi:MAG TPA: hypothetical protein VF746_13495 [Longimicrobium sp.]|jgi:hypothetical protein
MMRLTRRRIRLRRDLPRLLARLAARGVLARAALLKRVERARLRLFGRKRLSKEPWAGERAAKKAIRRAFP